MTRYTETRPKHETTRPRNLIRDYENARTNLGDPSCEVKDSILAEGIRY